MHRLRIAKDIMVTKLVTAAPDADIFDGVRLLLRHGISGVPVVDGGQRYLGTLTDRCSIEVLTLTADEGELEGGAALRARDFMATGLLTLKAETDSFEAIELLLKNRFSGAPVVDDDDNFLGVFSERYIMRLLISSAYDQVPSTKVGAFMNTDRRRLIDENAELADVARMFLDSPYRRLPVLRDGKLIGQVSRRDVLRADHHLARFLATRRPPLRWMQREPRLADVWHPGGDVNAAATRVSRFMDSDAPTITEDMDFLAIAGVFLESNRRRLPVLRDDRLVGQISRRDLLAEVLESLADKAYREPTGLYLSAVAEAEENPVLRGTQQETSRPAHGPPSGTTRHPQRS
jgi:CBS domain-containing protein